MKDCALSNALGPFNASACKGKRSVLVIEILFGSFWFFQLDAMRAK
jgi:hypothetical protein